MPSTITPSSRSSDFEPRKFTPMSELQPQPTTPQDSTQTNLSQSLTPTSQNSPVSQQQLPDSIQQLTSFKAPLPVLPPRVLEYSPHYGPEGQTFTMTLQSNTEKTLRIGFGTLVVDTKQYSANGYVTLSCTVPSFAITKWFVSKVPLYVLQMENDMVMESWPFGDYNYYDNMGFGETNGVGVSAAPQQSSNKRAYAGPQDLGGQSPLETKRPHLELDLSQTQLAGSNTQSLSPLPPSTPTSAHNLGPRRKLIFLFSFIAVHLFIWVFVKKENIISRLTSIPESPFPLPQLDEEKKICGVRRKKCSGVVWSGGRKKESERV